MTISHFKTTINHHFKQRIKMFLKKLNLLLLPTIIIHLFTTAAFSYCEAPFSYDWETEIKINNDPSFPLNPEFSSFAETQHAHLRKSPLFNKEAIKNPALSRQLLLEMGGMEVTIQTEDGENITCMYFNNNSETLLVVGAGFTNPKEKMCPFVEMFKGKYDIVIFDYRGQEYSEEPITWCPCYWQGNPLIKKFGVDNRKARIGKVEKNDVFAVVNFFKNQKQYWNPRGYEKVVGLGVCLSTMIFFDTESSRPGTFTHLILDGCWISLEAFVNQLYKDLKLIFSPQYGGWANHWFYDSRSLKFCIYHLANYLLSLKTNNSCVLDYLPNLRSNIPVLLFYGKDDLTITRQQFETIWQNLNVDQKTAIVTSNPHVINHLNQPGLYKTICETFIDYGQEGLLDASFTR